MSKNVMIIAGEASGDMYGAKVVEEAHRLDSSVHFFGIGGPKMREVGVDTVIDATEMAVMGLFEVIAHLPVILRAYKLCRSILLNRKPDLLILIDYPGFNLRLAALAKKSGVKVLYFITPQVWAWHASRVNKIARLVDHAAVIFPFEVPLFEKAGLPVTFVGHPLLDMAVATASREDSLLDFGLEGARKVIGLFPGSRTREINSLLPVMLNAAVILQSEFPDARFVLPLAPGVDRGLIDGFLSRFNLDVKVVENRNYDVIQVCDAIIAASGTVTMEIALFGVPMVIVYKTAPLTYAIGKLVVNVDHVGICNIVAGERIVPELLQNDAEPVGVAAEISRYLVDRQYSSSVSDKLLQVRKMLGEPGAPARVASIALQLLKS